MDPLTWRHLGMIRQREILDAAAQDRQTPILRPLAARIGRLLIAAGEKLVTAAQPAFAEVAAVDDLNEAEAC
jgi:hypothetical protein